MKVRAVRAVAILLALGGVWRLIRYAVRFPFWGDEAFVGLNLLNKGFRALTGPLEWNQVAPLLFLWSEKAAQLLLGPTELSLRLLPLLAGLAALPIFHRLARLALEPLEADLATGIFAVSYLPLRFACEVKPYSLDLLASTALLLLALEWKSEPSRLVGPIVLVGVTPLAVALSYPSVFVLAAAGLTLIPGAWSDRRPATKLLFAGWVVSAAAVFVFLFFVADAAQFRGQGGFRNLFWQDAFPPAHPVKLLLWLVSVHTGAMLGYPAGGNDGGSTLTFLLCVLGVFALRKSSRPGLLPMCLLPFGFTLLASALHLYPYGNPRVAQHLVAPICLLAGAGAGAALRFRSSPPEAVRRRALPVFAALGLLASVGMAVDVVQPYRGKSDVNLRAVARSIAAVAQPGDRVIVVSIEEEPPPAVLQFYLRREGLSVCFDGALGANPLPRQVFVVSFRPPEETRALRERLMSASPPFAPAGETTYDVKGAFDRTPPGACFVTRWRRAG